MRTGFTHYYFLLSCPSDVESDINIILEVVNDVNHTIGASCIIKSVDVEI